MDDRMYNEFIRMSNEVYKNTVIEAGKPNPILWCSGSALRKIASHEGVSRNTPLSVVAKEFGLRRVTGGYKRKSK